MITVNDKRLCEACFAEVASDVCPECGFEKAFSRHDNTVLTMGSVLEDRYLIGKVIGKGGFGITYLAYDMKLRCRVAIKEYFPYGVAVRDNDMTTVSVSSEDSASTFKEGADKFYEEARLVAGFNGNPNIVSVYDFFYGNDTVYFTMGYLQGVTLKKYIADKGILSTSKAVRLANDVCNALMVAHSENVLHRDISPDNIMICNDGTIKLLDFGAARQVFTDESRSLSVILKQGFAPLEQYQKRGKQGPWTDIYSLGATIYYSLTGDVIDDPMSRLDDDDDFASNRYGIHEGLWKIIVKATKLKPKERYQDVFELREELESLNIAPEPLINVDYRKKSRKSITQQINTESAPVSSVTSEKKTPDSNIGGTMPVKEVSPIGVTMPAKEAATIGVTMHAKEAVDDNISITMPVSDERLKTAEKSSDKKNSIGVIISAVAGVAVISAGIAAIALSDDSQKINVADSTTTTVSENTTAITSTTESAADTAEAIATTLKTETTTVSSLAERTSSASSERIRPEASYPERSPVTSPAVSSETTKTEITTPATTTTVITTSGTPSQTRPSAVTTPKTTVAKTTSAASEITQVKNKEYTLVVDYDTGKKYKGKYTGGWKDGKPEGEGKFTASDVVDPIGKYDYTYEGEWKKGERNGNGKATAKYEQITTTWECNFVNGKMQGDCSCRQTNSDGATFVSKKKIVDDHVVYYYEMVIKFADGSSMFYEGEGSYNEETGYDSFHGKGYSESVNANGVKIILDGKFYNDYLSSGIYKEIGESYTYSFEGDLEIDDSKLYYRFIDGKEIYSDNTGFSCSFEGKYDNTGRWSNGRIVQSFSDGSAITYEGGLRYNESTGYVEYSGYGLFTYTDGKGYTLIYEGQFANDAQNGQGRQEQIYANGTKKVYEGQFVNGDIYDGTVYEYNSNGSLISSGEIIDGVIP